MRPSNDISVKQIDPKSLDSVINLRYRVLDEPLGIDKQTFPSSSDVKDDVIHVGGYLDDKLISAVRLDKIDNNTYLIRRMATDITYRKLGIGSMVLKFAEKLAVENGAKRFVLHSRPSAVSFYEKMGYIANGSFEEHDGLNEPEMEKDI